MIGSSVGGEGRSFVAGADISEMSNLNAAEGRSFSTKGNNLFRKVELMEKPVIAAVNGFALALRVHKDNLGL